MQDIIVQYQNLLKEQSHLEQTGLSHEQNCQHSPFKDKDRHDQRDDGMQIEGDPP